MTLTSLKYYWMSAKTRQLLKRLRGLPIPEQYLRTAALRQANRLYIESDGNSEALVSASVKSSSILKLHPSSADTFGAKLCIHWAELGLESHLRMDKRWWALWGLFSTVCTSTTMHATGHNSFDILDCAANYLGHFMEIDGLKTELANIFIDALSDVSTRSRLNKSLEYIETPTDSVTLMNMAQIASSLAIDHFILAVSGSRNEQGRNHLLCDAYCVVCLYCNGRMGFLDSEKGRHDLYDMAAYFISACIASRKL